MKTPRSKQRGYRIFATGGTLLKILPDELPMVSLSIILLVIGVVISIAGAKRFFMLKRNRLALMRKSMSSNMLKD
jgi:hypothetical protein